MLNCSPFKLINLLIKNSIKHQEMKLFNLNRMILMHVSAIISSNLSKLSTPVKGRSTFVVGIWRIHKEIYIDQDSVFKIEVFLWEREEPLSCMNPILTPISIMVEKQLIRVKLNLPRPLSVGLNKTVLLILSERRSEYPLKIRRRRINNKSNQLRNNHSGIFLTGFAK